LHDIKYSIKQLTRIQTSIQNEFLKKFKIFPQSDSTTTWQHASDAPASQLLTQSLNCRTTSCITPIVL